jgi:hypothetical protein
MNFHRRGARVFIKDRLLRIALPLVVGWPIVFAAMVAVVFWAAHFPNGGPVPGAAGWPPMLPGFPLTHLWFLYVLLEFYAATLVLRTGMAWLDKSGRIRAGVDRLIGLVMRSPLAPAILAVPIGIALNYDPAWRGLQGVPTPDQSLVTNLQAVVGFGTAFGFGWLLHRQIDLIRILERRWLLNLVLAIGLIAASFVLATVPPRPDPIRLADVTCYALAIWTTTFAAIGMALHFLFGYSAARRYVADASYWLHLPIVMALQGRGLLPRLAVASQVRDDPAGRRPGHVCQLPTSGTLQHYWSGAEWPSHTKTLGSQRVSSKLIASFLNTAQTSNRDRCPSGYQKLTSTVVRAMSALPPKVDIPYPTFREYLSHRLFAFSLLGPYRSPPSWRQPQPASVGNRRTS